MTTFGEVELNRDLLRIGHRGADARPVYRTFLSHLLDIERAQFATEGARGGSPWERLNRSYARRKRQRWGNRPIMVASGRLFASLTQRGSRDQFFRANASGFHFGSRVPYAIYHQSRSPRRSGLPRRPLVALTEADRRYFVKAVQHYIMTGHTPL